MAPRLPAISTPPVTPTTTVPGNVPRLPKSLQTPAAPAVTVPTPTPTATVPSNVPRLPKSLQTATSGTAPIVQGPPAPGTTRADIPLATPIDIAASATQGPPAPGTSRQDLVNATRNYNRAVLNAQRAGLEQSKIEEITQDAEPNAALKVIGKVINFDILPGKLEFKPISTAVIKPLTALDTGRRVIQSTLKEVGDEVAVWRGTRGRGVGISPETGRPYRAGEGGFDIGDWWDQVTNTEDPIGYGQLVGNVFSPDTLAGRIGNRAIGFTGDVFLDPIAWVGGPAGVAKGAITSGIEAGAKTAAREAAETTARTLADDAARIAADATATAAAKTAAQKAATDAAAAAAKAATDEAVALAAAKTASVNAPRRVIGARSREEVAQIAREARDEAIQAGNRAVADALTDDVIADISLRGYSAIRGPVADALNVRGGFRVINPFAALTSDTYKVVVPGTERITNAIGSTLTAVRLGPARQITTGLNTPLVRNVVNTINKGFVGTEFGRNIVNGVTPTGEGGLWGSEAISTMRNALRTGKTVDSKTGAVRRLLPAEAEDFVKLLAQDRAYRLLYAESSAKGIQLLMPVLGDRNFFKYSNEISDLLETPAISSIISDGTIDVAEKTRRISAALGRPVDQELVQYADNLRRVGDEFYAQANFLHQRQQLAAGLPLDAVKDLPKKRNWFPHILSDRARQAIDRNQISADVLQDATGFDKTFALAGSNPRTLVAGDRFFGYKLLPEDIDGGVKRLNEIARQYGKLKYDFFETNAEAAFTRYAQGFAKDTAFTNWLYNMAQASDGQGPLAAKGFGNDIIQRQVQTTPAKPPSTIQGFTAAVEDVLSPERVQVLSQRPELVAKVEKVITDMQALQARFPKDMARVPAGFTLWRDDINYAINQLELQIRELERLAPSQAGFAVPDIGFGPTLSSEADALYTSLLNEANGIQLAVNSVRPDMWVNILPQWSTGFENLLRVNSLKYPGLISSPEVQELLQNVRRLEDPAIARGTNLLFNRTTGMFKAWVTATPGFHTRNG